MGGKGRAKLSKADKAKKEDAKRRERAKREAEEAHLWAPVDEREEEQLGGQGAAVLAKTKGGEEGGRVNGLGAPTDVLGRKLKTKKYQKGAKMAKRAARQMDKHKRAEGAVGRGRRRQEVGGTQSMGRQGEGGGGKEGLSNAPAVSSFYAKGLVGRLLLQGSINSKDLPGNGNRQPLSASLKSAFAALSEEELEARRQQSRQPLQRDQRSVEAQDLACLKAEIALPQRPVWHKRMTKVEMDEKELRYFKEYLERLYQRYGANRLNHFEHNLQVWRQLWRVCERSDIIIVVCDARHPLFHFPASLYTYLQQLDQASFADDTAPINDSNPLDNAQVRRKRKRRPLVVVFSKTDLVDSSHVAKWTAYFKLHFPAVHVVPFTCVSAAAAAAPSSSARRARGTHAMRLPAAAAAGRLEKVCQLAVQEAFARGDMCVTREAAEGFSLTSDRVFKKKYDVEKIPQQQQQQQRGKGKEKGNGKGKRKAVSKKIKKKDWEEEGVAEGTEEEAQETGVLSDENVSMNDVGEVDGAGEGEGRFYDGGGNVLFPVDFVTVATIGHPNAGKSSLINALVGKKVVSVSQSPGHTKHLQTYFINRRSRLCDCPGLVVPAADMPRAMQVLSGLFPIAQTRDPYSCVRFLAERVPVETFYGLTHPSLTHSPTEQGQGPKKTVRQLTDSQTDRLTYAKEVRRTDEDKQSSVIGDASPDAPPLASSAAASDGVAWSAWQLCEALAEKRGFRTRGGGPDVYRAANFILRDALEGKILLQFDPPPAALQKAASLACLGGGSAEEGDGLNDVVNAGECCESKSKENLQSIIGKELQGQHDTMEGLAANAEASTMAASE